MAHPPPTPTGPGVQGPLLLNMATGSWAALSLVMLPLLQTAAPVSQTHSLTARETSYIASREKEHIDLSLLPVAIRGESMFQMVRRRPPKSRISGEVFAEGSAPWSKPSLEIVKVGFLGRCLPKAAPPGRHRAWIWAPRGPRGPMDHHFGPKNHNSGAKNHHLGAKNGKM